MPTPTENALYLGDGVYVDYNGYALILTTTDGSGTTNVITLEPEVYQELAAYAERFLK